MRWRAFVSFCVPCCVPRRLCSALRVVFLAAILAVVLGLLTVFPTVFPLVPPAMVRILRLVLLCCVCYPVASVPSPSSPQEMSTLYPKLVSHKFCNSLMARYHKVLGSLFRGHGLGSRVPGLVSGLWVWWFFWRRWTQEDRCTLTHKTQQHATHLCIPPAGQGSYPAPSDRNLFSQPLNHTHST